MIYKKIIDKIAGNSKEFKEKNKGFFIGDEKERIDSYIKNNTRNVKTVLLAIILLFVISTVKEILPKNNLILNDDGFVKEIKIDRNLPRQRIEIKARIGEYEKEVNLDYKKAKSNKSFKKEKGTDYYLSRIISRLENNKSDIIKLPETLETGEKVLWEKQQNNNTIIIFIISIVVIFSLYKNKFGKFKRDKDKAVEEIRAELPVLLNKIILIWESGKTFENSVKKVIEQLKENKKNYMITNLKNIYSQSDTEKKDIILAINEFAKRTGVKDFIRIANIMVENQFKGSFLLEKLEMERELIWLKKKKEAETQGKLAETKLVLPMALLLMTLIVITITPAILKI